MEICFSLRQLNNLHKQHRQDVLSYRAGTEEVASAFRLSTSSQRLSISCAV